MRKHSNKKQSSFQGQRLGEEIDGKEAEETFWMDGNFYGPW